MIFGFSSAVEKARLYVGTYIYPFACTLIFCPFFHYLRLHIHQLPVLLLYPTLLSLEKIYHEGKSSRP